MSINKLNRLLGIEQQTTQMEQIDEGDDKSNDSSSRVSKRLSKKESSFSIPSKASKSKGTTEGGQKKKS